MQGVPDDEDESSLLLIVTDSLPEVPKEDLVSLKETEQASAGNLFIGVNGGVADDAAALTLAVISSSPEEPLSVSVSRREGDVSGVSNGVSVLLINLLLS